MDNFFQFDLLHLPFLQYLLMSQSLDNTNHNIGLALPLTTLSLRRTVCCHFMAASPGLTVVTNKMNWILSMLKFFILLRFLILIHLNLPPSMSVKESLRVGALV